MKKLIVDIFCSFFLYGLFFRVWDSVVNNGIVSNITVMRHAIVLLVLLGIAIQFRINEAVTS